MTREQKIWQGGKVLWHSAKPLLGYLFLPGLLMSIGMLLRRYQKSADSFAAESGNFYIFVSFLILGFLFWRRAKKRGNSFLEEITLSFRQPDYRYAGFCVLFGASAGLFLSAVITLLPLPAWLIASYDQKSSAMFEGNDLILVVLTVSFAAPLMEEIVFRGYMLNRLMSFFSEKQAVWITSVCFALCHANLLWILYALGMGWILAKVSLNKDNILYSVCIHMGFNLPSVILACLQSTEWAEHLLFGSRVLILCYGVSAAVLLKMAVMHMKEE